MRTSLFLTIACLLMMAACKKSNDTETDERWVERSQGQEVIVFKEALPKANNVERSFYFQARELPPYSSVSSPSGIYFYTLDGDTLQLKTSGQRVYFKMSADGKSFTIGRFFPNYNRMPDQVTFDRK